MHSWDLATHLLDFYVASLTINNSLDHAWPSWVLYTPSEGIQLVTISNTMVIYGKQANKSEATEGQGQEAGRAGDSLSGAL